MAYCSKCGGEVHDEAEICIHCGCRIKGSSGVDTNAIVRFLLTFLLGFIGSFVINHSGLRPIGYKSRTAAYFWLGIFTFGIYPLVASICNLTFNSSNPSNIGYFKVNY